MDPAELEKRTQELLMHFDAIDVEAIKAMMSDNAQGIDELSRKWLRGMESLEDYFLTVVSQMSDVHSDPSDFCVRMHGEVGIVTFMLNQSYRFAGAIYKVTAPSTVIYVREHGDWKVALVHSVAIPDGGSES